MEGNSDIEVKAMSVKKVKINGRECFVTYDELERSEIEKNCSSSKDEYFSDTYCSNGTCEGCPVYEDKENLS